MSVGCLLPGSEASFNSQRTSACSFRRTLLKDLIMKLISRILICLVSLLAAAGASAQGSDWRSVLEAEKAKNAQRIAAINQQAAPLVAQLKQVNAAVTRHNANPCTYPENNPEKCAGYERERAQLDGAVQRLRSTLIPLSNELDRLQARNTEIDQKLKHCVQTPHPCSSDADCECSYSCATFDGRGNSGFCQPASR